MQTNIKKKLKHVSFLLAEEELNALKFWCYINGKSVSESVRKIVRRELGVEPPPVRKPNGGAQ